MELEEHEHAGELRGQLHGPECSGSLCPGIALERANLLPCPAIWCDAVSQHAQCFSKHSQPSSFPPAAHWSTLVVLCAAGAAAGRRRRRGPATDVPRAVPRGTQADRAPDICWGRGRSGVLPLCWNCGRPIPHRLHPLREPPGRPSMCMLARR